jgi:hypothetical protein
MTLGSPAPWAESSPESGDETSAAPWRLAPFVLALIAGLAMRLWWIHAHAALGGDPQVYADIARNWLQHGVYGVTVKDASGSHIEPTLIRLPGYPLFLAACFRLFGVLNFRAVLYVQALVDLATCAMLAATARALWSRRAGMATLWLAALCPFTSTYVAAPLTETLELAMITASLLVCVRCVQRERAGWPNLLALAATWGYAALLRPDGALLAVTLCPALVLYTRGRLLRTAVVAGLLSVVPFAPWAIRNWHTFHVFEPLAPRYATDPSEPTHPGFQRWTKTVCVDFTCTQEVYWNMDSDVIDIASLPSRAFDSPAQYEATRQLLAEYNRTTTLTDAEDARFAELAEEHVQAHPLDYYVGLPLARVADMWLRPRLELLPNSLRWWQFWDHHGETEVAYAAAGINLGYLLLAVWGACRRPRFLGAMVVFFVLRSLLLATIEAPEQRYTLECLPMVFVLAGVALGGLKARPPARLAVTW